jgi:DNA invertase Pin-like site-specific DNA recombinase
MSTTASPAPTGTAPASRLALAACRADETLVVTKLDRLARSLPDARDILDELTAQRQTQPRRLNP